MTKSYRRLNMLMAKPLGDGETVADLLSDIPVDGYELQGGSGLSGALYVKRSIEKRPLWGPLLDEIAGAPVSGLTNRSSSAVLLLRVDGDVFAFVFGYGRYLLELLRIPVDLISGSSVVTRQSSVHGQTRHQWADLLPCF